MQMWCDFLSVGGGVLCFSERGFRGLKKKKKLLSGLIAVVEKTMQIKIHVFPEQRC